MVKYVSTKAFFLVSCVALTAIMSIAALFVLAQAENHALFVSDVHAEQRLGTMLGDTIIFSDQYPHCVPLSSNVISIGSRRWISCSSAVYAASAWVMSPSRPITSSLTAASTTEAAKKLLADPLRV